MNKCDKCGGIHWRTAPCIQPRVRIGTDGLTAKETPKSSVSAEPPHHEVHTQSTTARMDAPQAAIAKRGSTGASVNAVVDREGGTTSVAGTQALLVDTKGEVAAVSPSGTHVGSASPAKFDRKAWMREYQRNYMRNVYRPKLKASKSQGETK